MPPLTLLVDTMALAFRSYYALQRTRMQTPSGTPSWVSYGFLSTMWNVLEATQPDRVIFACDHRTPTFRHKLYPEYKSNRGEMDQELASQLPLVWELLTAWGMVQVVMPGFEADDIIATLALRESMEPGRDVLIFSGDKDFRQLLAPHITLLRSDRQGNLIRETPEDVQQRYGFGPEAFCELLALWGDSSDNVPGAFGIGEKTAAQLVAKYGSVAEIYRHLDELPPRRRAQLQAATEAVALSRQLVTLRSDLDLAAFDLTQAQGSVELWLNRPGLLQYCEQMAFRTLVERIRARTPAPSLAVVTRSDFEFTCVCVDDYAKLGKLDAELSEATLIAFDTTATGLDSRRDRPIGISFCGDPRRAFYVPLVPPHLDGPIHAEVLVRFLAEVFAHPDRMWLAHNLKFHLHMLAQLGIGPPQQVSDPMLLTHSGALGAEGSYELDALCFEHLGKRKTSLSAVLGADSRATLSSAALAEVARYGAENAVATLLLQRHVQQILPAAVQTWTREVEAPLSAVLAAMERRGILFSESALETLSAELAEAVAMLEAEICAQAGETFNVASPKQLAAILYDKLRVHEHLGIKRIKKTKSGFATDRETLERMQTHPVVARLLEHRSLAKLRNTYVDPLPRLVDPETGRLHTQFHQTGTATGRLSSSNPNLQNIPIRSAVGQKVRGAFIAPPGWRLISADYSQIELRVLAHMSQDTGLQQAFATGVDIHAATAASVFGIPVEHVDRQLRARAKAINYGLAYGMGPSRLAAATGVSHDEAKQFMAQYFRSFPGILTYLEHCVAAVEAHGYAETLYGRRRRIDGLDDAGLRAVAARHMAINTPIQGSSAELIKIAMVDLERELRANRLKGQLLLQVHDELLLEAPEAELEEVTHWVRTCMVRAGADRLTVKLEVDVGIGGNWLDAH